MKKINYLLIAAIASLTVASCQKEQAEQFTPAGQGAGQEFTVSLPEVTKTALVEGKTVWAKNDSLWVSNGTLTEKIGVPEESWGQKSFTFKTKGTMITPETPNMYVVYPYEAAAGVKDGKVSVKVPGVQDGQFKNANIAAAQTTTYSVSLKNVTAILKVTVPEETKAPVYSLAIGAANGNAVTGTCTVDLSGSEPVLTPSVKATSISAQVDGLTGDFYFAVIPGSFDAGFTLTAATTNFTFASQTKVTKSAKSVKANELYDLGNIGDDLKPLNGAGTEAEPWQIETLGHMIALSSAVAEGRDFSGEYLKVMNDISGVTNQIGYYIGTDMKAFKGTFDGNDKTITVDINGAASPDVQRIGLFGEVADGATIKNLTINGSVTTTGGAVAGLVGRIDISKECTTPVTISHVTNNASVTGSSWLGGIAGYATVNAKNMLVIDHCKNTGTVKGSGYNNGGIIGQIAASANTNNIVVSDCENTGDISGTYCIAGISGYTFASTLSSCTNSGKVTATAAATGTTGATGKGAIGTQKNYQQCAGGISGWTQNTTVKDCTNNGDVKSSGGAAGGIVGEINSTTWTTFTVEDCVNNGKVSANGQGIGGIAGRAMGSTGKSIEFVRCKNTGTLSNASSIMGGIVGHALGFQDNSVEMLVNDCVNEGALNSMYWIGGIVGYVTSRTNGNNTLITIRNCENKGVITANRSDGDNGEVSGGILGAASVSTSTGFAASKAHIYNCINNGNVEYKQTAHKGVYMGGIVGRGGSTTTVENVVNNAYVGPQGNVEPVEGAGARLGAIYGSIDAASVVLKYAYYKNGVCTTVVGTAGKPLPDEATVTNYNADGELAMPVKVADVDQSILDEALNAWVNANKTDTTPYLAWGWTTAMTRTVKCSCNDL